ncbi:glutaconate CoA-transferase subunit B [Fontimonas thermophila]|uniref:Glutaconate CoA-transferase subunit B n=1 Tax=Fontimonas thermophila TaxID=1076937 RepID=A0A1I2JW33_9GAMM|nr:ketoacid CoA transferase [Fontimonas thermophila]SFF57247.1 glutaconate CoA-transferase subunit B [Fontimonas thermophila]
MATASDFTLAELLICACAEVWRGDGEVLATGIGVIPRLAQGLAKLTHSPQLMITDGEAYLTENPVALGAKNHEGRVYAGWMPYARVFDNVWSGRRHALVGPVQIDRWGQANISCVGDFARPKRQLLGLRGFPGNSINHTNSFFVPHHSPRVFVSGEVDVVCSVGYRRERWGSGIRQDFMRLHRIVTDLCVMDFGGPDHAIRVISLHPGVSFDAVQAATGFALVKAADLVETAHPTEEQLAIIRQLDPQNLRSQQIKGNPPGRRA